MTPMDHAEGSRPAGYEAPRVEQVLEARELEREVLYAGAVSPDV